MSHTVKRIGNNSKILVPPTLSSHGVPRRAYEATGGTPELRGAGHLAAKGLSGYPEAYMDVIVSPSGNPMRCLRPNVATDSLAEACFSIC